MKWDRILSVPKSFYVSWRLTSFREALRLPVQVRYDTVLKDLHGRVSGPAGRWKLRIGFNDVGFMDRGRARCVLLIRGEIRMGGKARLGIGSKLLVADGAVLTLGDGFFNSGTLTVVCDKEVTFHDGSMIGWDSVVMDTDLHHVREVATGRVFPRTVPVELGKGVWCGMDVKLLKGTFIADGSIVGAGSVVAKRFETPYSVIAGNPAALRKEGYTFEK